VTGVPFSVAADFFNPVFGIGFGFALASGAVVPMPEAAVNKDDFLAGRKNQIGFSWKVFSVKPEAVTEAVNQ